MDSGDDDGATSSMNPVDLFTSSLPKAGQTSIQVDPPPTDYPLIEDSGGQKLLPGRFLEGEEPPPKQQWYIFKVPDHIRNGVERAYSPNTVPIGPFFYKKPGFEAMEAQKLRFLQRNGLLIHDQLDKFKVEMKKLEGETRECYSEDFKEIHSDDFVSMMVVDGCFIVELLRLSGRRYRGTLADDPIFAARTMPMNLARDLLILENQLPLFVLQKLFELMSSGQQESSESETSLNLNSLALQFFEPLRPGKDAIVIPTESDTAASKQHPHLLALFHSSFALKPKKRRRLCCLRRQPIPPRRRSNRFGTFVGRGWTRNAKYLSNAGVRFRNYKSSGNVLDIKFSTSNIFRSVLKIPAVFFDDNTTGIFRNLVAYEQFDRSAPPHFTSLAVFYNNILHDQHDVAILKKSAIVIQGHGTNEEVVSFFGSLTKDLVLHMDNNFYAELITKINRYCRTRRARVNIFYRRYRSVVRRWLMNIFMFYISIFLSLFYFKAQKTGGD